VLDTTGSERSVAAIRAAAQLTQGVRWRVRAVEAMILVSFPVAGAALR